MVFDINRETHLPWSEQSTEPVSYDTFNTLFNSFGKGSTTVYPRDSACTAGFPGPQSDYLSLEPELATKFSDVVTGLGVSVISGRVHQIAPDV